MKKINSLSLAAAVLPGLLLLGSYFFLRTEPRFILGLDRFVEMGADFRFPLAALIQSFFENMTGPNGLQVQVPGLLRGLQLGLHATAAGLICLLISRQGLHPAGAGLAGLVYCCHPLAIAVVAPLDHTGLALAMTLGLLSVVQADHSHRATGLGLVAGLCHPVGLLSPFFHRLFGTTASRPLLIGSGVLFVVYAALLGPDPSRTLPLAGHSVLSLVKGWQVGGALDWSSLVAWERIDTGGRSLFLAGSYCVLTGAVLGLAKFGSLTAAPLQRAWPLLALAPLLPGLTPISGEARPDLGYGVPLLLVIAAFAGWLLSGLIQGPEPDANVQPPLGHVFARAVPLGFFAAMLPLAATVQQLPAFENGLTFWRAQRAREEGSAGARYGLARATLYFQTHPRRLESGNISQLAAVRGLEVLDNLFDEIEARRANDQPIGIPTEIEAEAHWMMSEAFRLPSAQDFEIALQALQKATQLAPDNEKYADALAAVSRDQPQYLQWVDGCSVETPERREYRRDLLMRQSTTLGQAGLIDAVPRKLRDAIRCAPDHPDGYLHLDKALQAIARGLMMEGEEAAGRQRFAESRQLLETLPPPLDKHPDLKAALAYLIQNLPIPTNTDAKGIATYRRDRQREARPLWEAVLRQDPKHAKAWMNLAYTILTDDGNAPLAKAYLDRALSLDSGLVKLAEVRRLVDTLTRRVKPGTPLPEAKIEPLVPSTDAGPAQQDGGPPAQ
ncbi:MAG: hypothetical protein CMH55_04840 [Myxococcales bacterium]|nr:hypothetical protein [Myxococcales bacterium]